MKNFIIGCLFMAGLIILSGVLVWRGFNWDIPVLKTAFLVVGYTGLVLFSYLSGRLLPEAWHEANDANED